MRASMRIAVAVAACCLSLLSAAAARASFNLEGFEVSYANEDGTPDIQAGSHPFEMATSFTVPSEVGPNGIGRILEEPAKDVLTEQITGLAGIPAATPRCSRRDFLVATTGLSGNVIPSCPNSTVLGYAAVTISNAVSLAPSAVVFQPIYNLAPPPGDVSTLGFWVSEQPVQVDVGVSESPPYRILAGSRDISQLAEVIGVRIVLWGIPAAPVHDPLRGGCLEKVSPDNSPLDPGSAGSCPAGTGEDPFLIMPRACKGSLLTSYAADSWANPGGYLEGGEPDLSDPRWGSGSAPLDGDSEGMSGCGRLGFEPSIQARPTPNASSSPVGLSFALNIEDEGIANPTGIAGSDVEKTEVSLPEGMTANPSVAEGIITCSEAQLARETSQSAPGEGCPNAAKIGTVEVETPLLEEDVDGALYLATPYENPEHTLIALYIVIKNKKLGIKIALPLKVLPNPVTGRLTTIAEGLPQLPFSHFRLRFREGVRSPLASPPLCGSYDAEAKLYPYSGGRPVTTTSTFEIVTGPNHGPCPPGGVRPFAPSLSAGLLDPGAGHYSPFYLDIGRGDTEQEISGFSIEMPPGFTAKLTGVPFCPEADIAAAEAREGAPNGGQEELDHPSCPAASEIGHTLVGTGVGPALTYVPGKLYLAGPYHGAPMSVVSITAAKAGPFDLGTVVIREALRIDEHTAQVFIDAGGSNPIPQILDGVPTDVRDINVYVDRPQFTIAPTDCEPQTIAAILTSGEGAVSAPENHFQVADCASLPFKPSFAAQTKAKHTRKDGAYLHVHVSSGDGQANIHEVHVELPVALPSRLSTLQKACTEAQFAKDPAGCPAESVVGHAIVHTPILPVPLIGPAYFVSHGGKKFPELIMVLQGYGITIQLAGETFISKAGITSSTFKHVPDVPFSTFDLTLPTGPNSALAANGNLCDQRLIMPTYLHGQNGAEIEQQTRIQPEGCSNTFSVRGHHIKKRTLTLKVYVPSAGKLRVGGKGLSSQTRRPRRMGIVTVKVHEKRAGKLRTRVEAVFTPSAGKARKRQVKRLSVHFRK